jgi:nicotinamide-nucleotide amidase
MNIEIISTGEEVLRGVIADENGAYMARTLTALGFSIGRHGCVGDDLNDLVTLFSEADGRARAVIVTGGLGPTVDDRTVLAASRAFGLPIVHNEAAERSVTAFFERWNMAVSDTNRKQMRLPDGAECLDNPVGTAPGFTLDTGKSRFFFLPGVPGEMRVMLDRHVLPRLSVMAGSDREIFRSRTLSLFGLPEAEVDRRLADMETVFPGVRLGLRAVFPVIDITLYAGGADVTAAERLLDQARDWALEAVGEHVFSTRGRSLAEEVGEGLRQGKKTLAVAESCTGGLIAHMLTNVAGSSDYFLLSAVTYANEAKVRLLGVPEPVIARTGAVSEETVRAMAEGVRRVSGARIGLATSGIAGPGGGSAEKPVGTVFIGLADDTGTRAFRLCLDMKNRLKNKTFFAVSALDYLRRHGGICAS